MVKGIIFDLDGVLVSTDKYHYQAWKKIADKLQVEFNETINDRLRGVSRMESLEIILEKAVGSQLSAEQKEMLAEEKNGYYKKLLDNLTEKDALDNAREAAGKMERQEDKEIRVRAGARKNFAVIRVENHFPGHVALDRAGEVKTTKAGEGHGYGIKNMRAAARRYGGEVSVEAKDGMFILTVAIPVSGNGEKADDL